MSLTPVKSRRCIVFEGVPGIGKSTATTRVARLLRDHYPELIVCLNFKPLVPDVQEEMESVLKNSERESTRGFDFIRSIYDPKQKARNLFAALSITPKLAAIEMDFIRAFPVKDTAEKHLINIIERNTASAVGVFIPANFYNMRECGDLSYEDRQLYGNDWDKDIIPVRDYMLLLTKSVLKMGDTTDRYDLIFMNGNPEYAHQRVVSRGRDWESQYLSKEYMIKLDQYQREFQGIMTTTKSVCWREVYPEGMAKEYDVNVDMFRPNKEFNKDQSIKNMTTYVFDLLKRIINDNYDF